MITLIENGEVYAPEPVVARDCRGDCTRQAHGEDGTLNVREKFLEDSFRNVSLIGEKFDPGLF